MKTRRRISPSSILLPALLCGFLGAATMANAASAMVLTKAAPSGGGHQHHGHQAQAVQAQQPRRRGGPSSLRLREGEGASVVLWRPDLSTDPLTIGEDGAIEFKPKVDNYHAVVAQRERDGVKEAAIRYEYMRGKPSPDSPSKLASALKTDLEIEPAPIPREHHRYMANKAWDFILRFEGQPLSDAVAVLETRQGSRLEAVSDKRGVTRFVIPDDFPETKPGRDNNPASEFVVSTRYEANGKRYATTLSAPYYVDPGHWESKGLGWAMASLGLLAGGLIGGIGVRKKGNNK